MDTGKMKNMVILRNLPSNIVEEAIVILKPNQKIKSLDYIENNKNSDKQNQTKANSKDYIINEAQMVISNYLSNIEVQKNIKYKNISKIENKYKILKILTITVGALLIINSIFNFINI